MVCSLLPVDPSSGEEIEEDKYYIFRKGTYAVGRKDCDIIIHKDKGVSRTHAHLIVDEMTKSSQVRVKDLSKYGTFINKNLSSSKKVHDFHYKETSLEDGDLLSFGTGNATYRFCYVPLVFYICCAEASQMNHHLEQKASSIGARLTHVFGEECTHVLVVQQMPLKKDLLDAVVAKKPVLCSSWLELVADKSICAELPDCRSHVPTIMVDGVSIKVSDQRIRENCLRGYTFLLESTDMYNFGDRLQSLLEMSGSRTVWVEDICSSSHAFHHGENIRLTYVIPGRSVDKFDHLDKLGLSFRVNEMALIRAVLSGNFDQSILIPSAVLVSSSCSTDETVVADSDEENEVNTPVNANAASDKEGPQTYVNRAEISTEASKDLKKEKVSTYDGASRLEDGQVTLKDDDYCSTERRNKPDDSEYGSRAEICMEASKDLKKEKVSTYDDASRLEDGQVTLKDDDYCSTERRNKTDDSEYGSSNIVYSQLLIVRGVNITSSSSFITNNEVINYKRFRKANIQSGNSFSNLVPFSKYPFKDNEFESGVMAESVKEEKKRKKMEAIAEDMFNNEKGRHRGLSGSSRGRRSRG